MKSRTRSLILTLVLCSLNASIAVGFQVYGEIARKWRSLGGAGGTLGAPISDEADVGDGRGRYNNFQGGTIFWSAKSGAHMMNGPIMPKWITLHGGKGFLGYPTTDELITPDNVGHFAHFEGGSIYWTPQTRAHEVHGLIRDKWASLHWERGFLGYPTSDEIQDGQYRRSNFQHGYIRWSEATGPVVSRTHNID